MNDKDFSWLSKPFGTPSDDDPDSVPTYGIFPEDIPDDPDDTSKDEPCKYCEGCLEYCRLEPFPDEGDFFWLIELMVREIKDLEAEIVRTRQVLAEYLPERWAEGLRADIFCDLSARFTDNPKYDRYVKYCHDGTDPMESKEQVSRMLRLRDGTDSTTYYHLLPKNNKKR